MLVLFETPAGFALFKVLDEGKLSKVEDLWNEFATADSARKIVKLKAFDKFENTAEALSAATLLIESKASKGLRKFLRSHCQGETLGVADSKLGNAIKEKLQIDCVHNNAVMELMRGVRNQLTELISGLASQDLAPMSLGLSHSLSRYKLKFSPDKVDTMIIQAIGLLDDLDKELNTYAMRVREWYGWHFPELAKIVQDNILYAKAVKLMGNRVNAAKLDFSEILNEEVEAELKEASMGTEVSDLDLMNIKELCDQVLSLSEYRAQLYDYLKSRMNTIAPNLTALVGARLIAHDSSLLNLAKQPGSTVQILGAEKALFRALKTKHATPKYGLIYHASLIGQAAPKLFKGKISRSLVAKAALAIRYDALGDGQDNTMGLENRAKAEHLEEPLGKHVRSYYGSQGGATLPNDTSVAVCTIEKANSLFNRLLEEDRLSKVGIVVIDELHMVADPHRGYLLEILLRKLRYAAREGNIQSSTGEGSGTSSSVSEKETVYSKIGIQHLYEQSGFDQIMECHLLEYLVNLLLCKKICSFILFP